MPIAHAAATAQVRPPVRKRHGFTGKYDRKATRVLVGFSEVVGRSARTP